MNRAPRLAPRIGARVIPRQCDGCGRVCGADARMAVGAFEPAGPATRLLYRLCVPCRDAMQAHLAALATPTGARPDSRAWQAAAPVLAELHARLTARCPAAMLAGLVAALQFDAALDAGDQQQVAA